MTGARFAPSPTGVFHVGNLRTAWISWKLARLLSERWIVRFEDIDRPRVVPGSQEQQRAELAAFGLVPDELLVQSAFHERHRLAFENAKRDGLVYPCQCSRKEVQLEIAGLASAPHEKMPQYSGRCRSGASNLDASTGRTIAWRFKMPDDSGMRDFIVARAGRHEFAPAYNWACAIDDLDGDYRVIVRAGDLASVLEEQREVQRALIAREGRGRIPAVFHCALVTQDSGERLEKRTKGVTASELGERGFSPARLTEAFARGFTPPELSRFAPEAILSESRDRLSLREVLA